MQVPYIARLSAIMFVCVLTSATWNQSISEASQADLQAPKQGVARAASGRAIGSVIDFIIDLPTGRILFAVVTPLTPHSETTSVILVPWSLAQVDSTGSVFNFAVTADAAQRAPRLSGKRWKRPLTSQWLTAAETYWRTHAARSSFPALSTLHVGKATALLGVHVVGADNTEVGTIRELVFDPDEGAIALVVLVRLASLQEQSHVEFLPLPWEQLYVEPSGDTLIAIAGQKTLT